MGLMIMSTLMAILTLIIREAKEPVAAAALALLVLCQAVGWYVHGRAAQQRATREEC